jgi:uncharacterized membrane protein YoaK (UPF0700 family)
MDYDDLRRLAFAVALTTIAGYVDAVGFLQVGHLFVSFMSGDSTQLAVAAARANWSEMGEAGGVIALFVIGVIAGRILSRAMKHRYRAAVLPTEAILLASAALFQTSGASVIVPMVLAMGLQNAALHKVGDIKTSLTYVTGTLVNFGEKLADAFSTSDPKQRWAWAPYLLLWLGLIIGAAFGALFYQMLQLRALLIPATALVILATVASSMEP